jgi:hypothetical protein
MKTDYQFFEVVPKEMNRLTAAKISCTSAQENDPRNAGFEVMLKNHENIGDYHHKVMRNSILEYGQNDRAGLGTPTRERSGKGDGEDFETSRAVEGEGCGMIARAIFFR